MKFNLLKHITMSKKANILTAIATAVALSTTPASAEKVEQLICDTKVACEKLSNSIQAQIKEIENSDDPDFDKLDELQNKLIAVEKAETSMELKETEEVKETDKKIAELKDALLLKSN